MTTKTDNAFDFSNLTANQRSLLVFNGWQIGSTVMNQPSKATVKKLIERGLVIPHEVKRGNMTVTEYEVPVAVHLAFCLSC